MKTFNEWLNESRYNSKEFKFQGWKKITKAQFIKEMSSHKSLFLDAVTLFDKPAEYAEEFMNTVATKTALNNIITNLKKSEKNWREVTSASQTKMVFTNKSTLYFDQVGDKMVFERDINDGVVYLYFKYDYDEKWDEHSLSFLFYYVEK